MLLILKYKKIREEFKVKKLRKTKIVGTIGPAGENKLEELFDAAKKYYNVTLKIDRYWMMTVDEKGNIKKSTLSGVDYICEKEMMIECSILYNLKRYTFRRNEMIIFGDESLKKVHEDLKAFLEKHSSKDKEESKK